MTNELCLTVALEEITCGFSCITARLQRPVSESYSAVVDAPALACSLINLCFFLKTSHKLCLPDGIIDVLVQWCPF